MVGALDNTNDDTNNSMESSSETPVPLAPATLLDCRLCELSFDTIEEKRQHAKSEWHVYKIRCRVAEPGTVITPPNGASQAPTRRSRHGRAPAPAQHRSVQSDEEESLGESSESDSTSEKNTTKFAPGECLFCSHTSKDFEDSLAHMHQAHSLVVPYQSSLVVDLQTLIWFLHLVIFGYRECICCEKRHRTVEAVQQHMTSRGHCRFNITDDMSEFYDMESLGRQAAETRSHPDEHTLRLPSGKLLGHRSYVDPTARSKQQDKSHASAASLPAPEQRHASTQIIASRKDRKEQSLITQYSQMRSGDQMSLVHLPESQQRSLLVARKKELDKAKRSERRKGSRMDHVGNMTAVHTNYYKQEVPVYMGG